MQVNWYCLVLVGMIVLDRSNVTTMQYDQLVKTGFPFLFPEIYALKVCTIKTRHDLTTISDSLAFKIVTFCDVASNCLFPVTRTCLKAVLLHVAASDYQCAWRNLRSLAEKAQQIMRRHVWPWQSQFTSVRCPQECFDNTITDFFHACISLAFSLLIIYQSNACWIKCFLTHIVWQYLKTISVRIFHISVFAISVEKKINFSDSIFLPIYLKTNISYIQSDATESNFSFSLPHCSRSWLSNHVWNPDTIPNFQFPGSCDSHTLSAALAWISSFNQFGGKLESRLPYLNSMRKPQTAVFGLTDLLLDIGALTAEVRWHSFAFHRNLQL